MSSLFNPCVGGAAATEAKCDALLTDLHQKLEIYTQQLRAAPESERPQICSTAFKQIRPLDREAAAILAALPSSLPTVPQLQARYQQLHEALGQFEAEARPYVKEPPKPSSPGFLTWLTGGAASEARTLVCRLDDLELALDRLESSLRMDGNQGAAAAAADQKSVNRASKEFEEFRVGHIVSRSSEETAKKAARLLRAMRGSSRWYDAAQVQMLLMRRNQYLVAFPFNAAAGLLGGGHQVSAAELARAFLEHHEAWEEALAETLGPKGVEEWRARAHRVIHQQDANQAAAKAHDRVPDCGALYIRKIRAFNLRKADFWDDSDPYVTITYGGATQQTGVIWNQNSPEWRTPGRHDEEEGAWQEMCFEVNSLAQEPILCVNVKDYDRFSFDDDLGGIDEGGSGGFNVIDALHGRLAGGQTVQPPKDLGGVKEASMTLLGGQQHAPTCLPSAEVCPDGTVRCRFLLAGKGSGDGGATIEFELFYDTTGSSGDPLVYQPEAQDQALLVVGQADVAMGNNKDAFATAGLGFFLETQGKTGVQAPENFSRDIFDEVWEYNRLLDQLSLMTTDSSRTGEQHNSMQQMLAREPGLEAVAGFLSDESLSRAGHGGTQAYLAQNASAVQMFLGTIESIQSIESKVKGDPIRLRAYTYQDELLPSIGEWSAERRKVLRNQVFMAKRHFAIANEDGKVHGMEMWLPMAICLILAIYGVAMASLMWGSDWEHRGWIMVAASLLALVILVASFCYGAQHISLLPHGKGYTRLESHRPPADAGGPAPV